MHMLDLLHRMENWVKSALIIGGVAEHTADLILLTEAANYDFIIVETVGLGQSEVVVDDMVDFFMLVMPPTMGDSLQVRKVTERKIGSEERNNGTQ